MKYFTRTLTGTAQALAITLAASCAAAASTVAVQDDTYSHTDVFPPHAEIHDGDVDVADTYRDAVYENVELVSGNNFLTDVFYIGAAGTYLATLTDLVFPTPLGELGMSVATPTRQLGMTLGAGSFLFDAQPGDYYLSLFANTNNRYSLGQYGVSITPANSASPVPLPPAVLLFASGLLALVRLPGRRSRATG